MSYRWLLLLCLLLPWPVFAASVQASLDRNDVHLGETVTLNLRIDGAMNASAPDLSALAGDFEVLGTSSNSVLTVANGRPSSQFMIGIALRPKHAGDLRIPSLTVAGSQTQPLSLHVGAPDASAHTGSDKDVFIETSAAPGHVYVGQQSLYTVRLFFDVNLDSGNLSDPHADGMDLRKLGGDTDYDAERNGRHYHVIERRYALIPQRAGSLTIPSIEFQGEAVDPNTPRDPRDFFGSGGLFGNTSPVTADSSPVTIDVQAAPADWGKTTWLPARTLTLDLEGVPNDNTITAGQPLTLHMSVEANGLPADALPVPSLPAIDGATVYPDQSSDTTHDDGQWLTGRRERSFAIIPQHAGTLTLPETTLTWFDVQSGQKQVATIPAHTLTVLAVANGTPATPSSSAQAVAPTSIVAGHAAAPVQMQAIPAVTSPKVWQWIAIGSIGLWLISAVVFWRSRKQTATPASTTDAASGDSSRKLREAFMNAARGNDHSAQARCLLNWARAERPDLRSLGQLSDALASSAQRAAIERLQWQQYASESGDQRIDLATAFTKGFVWRDSNEPGQESPLPPLYPFKLD